MSSIETIEDDNPQPEAALLTGEEPAVHEDEHGHDHTAPTLNPECAREVEIEIPADEVTRSFRMVTKRYQKAARIPGFRSGKVPESLIRSRYREQIHQDVIEAIVPAHFRSAIAERNLTPASRPQITRIDLEDGKPLRLKAAFEVLPEFSIEGYEQTTVEKPDVTLTDAEFNQELERIRDSRSTMEPVEEDRALADGDFADVRFTGSVQPAAEGSEEPAAEAQPITGDDVLLEVGGANTIESFTAALRGAHAGQQLKFEVSYPEDSSERRLAGKTVAYDVEVKSIKKKIQPELNDEFAKGLGDYESLADFSEKLREHLANEKRRRLENEARHRLMDALVARYDFPVPESLVQQQIDVRLDRGLRALAAQGMPPEEMRKLDFDHLREAQRDSAAAEVKGTILLDRIADQEKIEVTEEEVTREIETISLEGREPVDTVRQRLTANGGLARIREQLRREKVGSLLYDRLPS